ncbi:4Fe-4S dicluster domain-containing protein [candidate division WOR-3 bacterium]|nr:4Fe-4S dicluster domain-containing protein [candidate division WOR-3 bacterium]
MEIYFLQKDKLINLLEILEKTGKVFWAREKELSSNRGVVRTISIEELNEDYIQDYQIPGLRAHDIFKPFLLPLRSKVCEYPDNEWADIKDATERTVLFGLKNCDLNAIGILDKIFLEDTEFIDPFYKRKRESLVIVSSDCISAGDSCFCNLLENTPYATSGFDINIAEVSDGYLLEAGTEAGEKILSELQTQEATRKAVKERDDRRKKVLNELKKQNARFEKAFSELSKRVSEGYNSIPGWALGSTCVSCGACTNVCPVCYCFTLFDRPFKRGDKSNRFMVWDSCQYKGFSQMAGGMNPRFSLMERFKNRYYHKFFRFRERYGLYKCTGCGRCIDNCLGNIDMREVLSGIKIGKDAN